ncbi:hypothetical protein ACPVPU_01720 [Sphingomonas sp. CJ99]
MSPVGEQVGWEAPLCVPGTGRWRAQVAWNLAAMQVEAMRAHFPSLRLIVNQAGISIWEGELQPLSSPYTIRVIDQRGVDDGEIIMPYRPPVVRVRAPQLSRRSSEPHRMVPHLYGPHDDPLGAHLCLYYPDGTEWTRQSLLAETILPWTAEWLFFYEMWHVTGTWGGAEAPHTPLDPPPAPAAVASRLSCRPLRMIDAHCMRSMSYMLMKQVHRTIREDAQSRAA